MAAYGGPTVSQPSCKLRVLDWTEYERDMLYKTLGAYGLTKCMFDPEMVRTKIPTKSPLEIMFVLEELGEAGEAVGDHHPSGRESDSDDDTTDGTDRPHITEDVEVDLGGVGELEDQIAVSVQEESRFLGSLSETLSEEELAKCSEIKRLAMAAFGSTRRVKMKISPTNHFPPQSHCELSDALTSWLQEVIPLAAALMRNRVRNTPRHRQGVRRGLEVHVRDVKVATRMISNSKDGVGFNVLFS